MRRKILHTFLITTFLLLSACFGHAPANEGCQGCVETPIVRPEQAFVKLMGFIGPELSTFGSGAVIANDDGGSYILTAAHICQHLEGVNLPPEVRAEAPPELLAALLTLHGMYHDGEMTPLTLVDYDITHDVCILRAVKKNAMTLQIAEESPEIGKLYKTYSSPKGLAGKGLTFVYEGYHSGAMTLPKLNVSYILYTIWSAPGSSGSPILNQDHEIVGIVSRYLKDGTPATISPNHKALKTYVKKALCDEKVPGYCSETSD